MDRVAPEGCRVIGPDNGLHACIAINQADLGKAADLSGAPEADAAAFLKGGLSNVLACRAVTAREEKVHLYAEKATGLESAMKALYLVVDPEGICRLEGYLLSNGDIFAKGLGLSAEYHMAAAYLFF